MHHANCSGAPLPTSEDAAPQCSLRHQKPMHVVGSMVLLMGCFAALILLASSIQSCHQPQQQQGVAQGQPLGKAEPRKLRVWAQQPQPALSGLTGSKDMRKDLKEGVFVQEYKHKSNRKLAQFFQQVGLGGQQGFPFFLDLVLDIFDNVGFAGIVKPVSTAVDRSLAQSHLCTSSAVARANLATCNNVPGFNALAVAG